MKEMGKGAISAKAQKEMAQQTKAIEAILNFLIARKSTTQIDVVYDFVIKLWIDYMKGEFSDEEIKHLYTAKFDTTTKDSLVDKAVNTNQKDYEMASEVVDLEGPLSNEELEELNDESNC